MGRYKGRLDFHERILKGGVEGLCFIENFHDGFKQRIYSVTGFSPTKISEGEKLKFNILYLDDNTSGTKTPEEVYFDVDATPKDLINLGKKLGHPRVLKQ